MAKIDLGKVVGENGTGGGSGVLTVGEKVYLNRMYINHASWYRKVGNLVELNTELFSHVIIPLAAYDYTTLGTLPSGYRPKEIITAITGGITTYYSGDGTPRSVYGCPLALRITTGGEIQLYNHYSDKLSIYGAMGHVMFPVA